MRQVKIESSNVYYNIGLQAVLDEIMQRRSSDTISLSATACHDNEEVLPTILFKDFMARIDFSGQQQNATEAADEHSGNAIHVPFFCRGYPLDECIIKIKKILELASLNYTYLNKSSMYENAGLRKSRQLSPVENNITSLIGKGKTVKCISTLLKRSERTVGTHCRNAINKMGMDNRLDFYKYAFYLERFGSENVITVCL